MTPSAGKGDPSWTLVDIIGGNQANPKNIFVIDIRINSRLHCLALMPADHPLITQKDRSCLTIVRRSFDAFENMSSKFVGGTSCLGRRLANSSSMTTWPLKHIRLFLSAYSWVVTSKKKITSSWCSRVLASSRVRELAVWLLRQTRSTSSEYWRSFSYPTHNSSYFRVDSWSYHALSTVTSCLDRGT